VSRLVANGIEVEYETLGDPAAPTILLIMGLGAQLITWDDGFCKALVDRGFQVIRYDNRDSGLSTKMESAGPADLMAAAGGDAVPAYTLDDLADDAVGVLDALGIGTAHIVGASMGGFIAQLVAINHPDRVLSLTSIMSGPGGSDAVPPTPEATAVLMQLPGPSREEQIVMGVLARELLVGRGNPFDPVVEKRKLERAYDRSHYPDGYFRQLAAVLGAGSRLERLAGVKVPTLVVHGADDPLVPVQNGRIVAAAVPGARLLELEGMGHNVPERYWGLVADAIADAARMAARPSG
jgi:pimeloyl-ACP methyl ester carboxylesterase